MEVESLFLARCPWGVHSSTFPWLTSGVPQTPVRPSPTRRPSSWPRQPASPMQRSPWQAGREHSGLAAELEQSRSGQGRRMWSGRDRRRQGAVGSCRAPAAVQRTRCPSQLRTCRPCCCRDKQRACRGAASRVTVRAYHARRCPPRSEKQWAIGHC